MRENLLNKVNLFIKTKLLKQKINKFLAEIKEHPMAEIHFDAIEKAEILQNYVLIEGHAVVSYLDEDGNATKPSKTFKLTYPISNIVNREVNAINEMKELYITLHSGRVDSLTIENYNGSLYSIQTLNS